MFHFGSVGGIIFQSEIAQAGRSVDFYKQARFALSHKNVPFYTTAFGTAILVGLALPYPLAYKQHFMLRFTAFTLRRMASGKETYEKKKYQ